MTVILQNVLDQLNDFNQNYTVTDIDQGNKTRAINRAIEFVQRQLGLPSDQRLYSFNFFEDTLFYDMPTGFNELIQLYYDNTTAAIDKNTRANRWYNYTDIEILRNTGYAPRQNRVGYTSVNGKNQLLLKGKNVSAPIVVNPFNTTTGLTLSSSVTNASADANIFRFNGASLKFDLTSGESTSQISFTGSWDIRALLNNSSAYRLWVFIPSGVDTTIISSIRIRLVSSSNNYYEVSATTDYLGNAWTANAWNLISFPLANATTTGSPNGASISEIDVRLVHGASFASVTSMRLNQFYAITPDLMEAAFYTAYKGTDTTGVTAKILLTETSDILNFGSYAPDLILPISMKAALILWPQLRGDANFWQIYKSEYSEIMKLYARSYPRKRTVPNISTQLNRP